MNNVFFKHTGAIVYNLLSNFSVMSWSYGRLIWSKDRKIILESSLDMIIFLVEKKSTSLPWWLIEGVKIWLTNYSHYWLRPGLFPLSWLCHWGQFLVDCPRTTPPQSPTQWHSTRSIRPFHMVAPHAMEASPWPIHNQANCHLKSNTQTKAKSNTFRYERKRGRKQINNHLA